MNDTRWRGLVVVALVLAAGCTPASDETAEQPADTAAAMTAPAADANGTWNMRSVPETGTDTTPTIFQVQVVDGNWTMLLPNRPPVVATVVTEGDSIVVDAGPFESVRRPGVTVMTHSVYRINGDQLDGTTIARYQGAGADSVLRLRSTGTRAN